MGNNNDTVIKVSRIFKDFKLPHEKSTTIKSAFINNLKGKRNRSVSVQHALKDINFEIKKGEFFGIVGRNGSGKSTLLKILAGIYQPTKGSVVTHGKLVPFIELGVGFNPELSGKENVYLNGSLLGFSKAQIDKMYDKIVDFAELDNFMDQKLKNYSSGMQVRLAFSMAVRAEADILLVDEVLAVGDADFQRKCFEYFRELKKEKKTVVFVSHDMAAVREYCDRAVLIDHSELISIGDTDKVARKYTKLFINEHEDTTDEANKKNKRWGDAKIKINIADVDNKILNEKDRVIRLSVSVEAIEDIHHQVAIGYMIKNNAGQSIMGTNTAAQHENLGKISKNDTIKITWSVPNVFGDGKYEVDIAATSSDGSVTHDWWESCVRFRVYNEEYTPYIITPKVPVLIDRK